MDWGNVSAEDLVEALRLVNSTSPSDRVLLQIYFPSLLLQMDKPSQMQYLSVRLFHHIFRLFSCSSFLGEKLFRINLVPEETGKAELYFCFHARCNICLRSVEFLTRPLALIATALTAVSIAFLNDSFAATFSEKVTRMVRQFSPHLAAKMRPSHMPVIRGCPSTRKTVYICGQPRWMFVFILTAVSFSLWFSSRSLLIVSWALLIGIIDIVLHATLRTPNLKACLNTFREEFRSVWRNYSEL